MSGHVPAHGSANRGALRSAASRSRRRRVSAALTESSGAIITGGGAGVHGHALHDGARGVTVQAEADTDALVRLPLLVGEPIPHAVDTDRGAVGSTLNFDAGQPVDAVAVQEVRFRRDASAPPRRKEKCAGPDGSRNTSRPERMPTFTSLQSVRTASRASRPPRTPSTSADRETCRRARRRRTPVLRLSALSKLAALANPPNSIVPRCCARDGTAQTSAAAPSRML